LADTHSTVVEHSEHDPAAHSPHLRHHFDDMAQQFDSATLGMWGSCSRKYVLRRNVRRLHGVPLHVSAAFASTSQYMNPLYGAMNTAV